MRLRVLKIVALMMFVFVGAGCQSVGGVGGAGVKSKISQVYLERVPEGSLLYVGWAGAGNELRGYAGSGLEGMVEASNVKDVIRDMLPAAIDRLAMEKAEVGAFKPTIEFIAKVIWEQRFALIVSDVDFKKGPKAALLIQRNEDVDSLKNMLNLMSMGLPEEIRSQLKMKDLDNELLITFGDFDAAALAVLKGEKVGGVGHAKGIVGDAVKVVYVDAGGIYKLVEKAFLVKGKGRGSKMGVMRLAILKDVLALNKMGGITISAGFDGGDWLSQGFIEVEKGAGIWGLMGDGKNGKALLTSVPASAEMASGFSFDFAKLFSIVEGVVEQLPMEEKMKFGLGLGWLRGCWMLI